MIRLREVFSLSIGNSCLISADKGCKELASFNMMLFPYIVFNYCHNNSSSQQTKRVGMIGYGLEIVNYVTY
ncbi:hypothetical protein AB9K26_02470 [Psychroserpens sp. XS_ASV72]|uniref:hypothetical protein n=1 Tax=Psychroserpens sp. XS_ASV72 TaxID=3241293 RepID=UPI0035111545